MKRASFLSGLLKTAAVTTLAAAMMVPAAQAIVPNDTTDSEEIVDDEVNVTGVGMFFRDDGFVCSGTLINPRTVLFAAHCVNDRPESDYGTTVGSAWSFQTDALPGFIEWFNNGQNTDESLYVYNVNEIIYNEESLVNPNAFGFIEADIALSSLDTPASDVPTWAVLFSPLPEPDSLDTVTGTGYHVDITGYGGTGTGTDGDIFGIDWRRRSAENMLGSLASLDDRNLFLFGSTFGDPTPQNLYSLDFDDPEGTNPFDFNLFLDEPLANEGTTAGGDSGGPLILDAENNDLTDQDIIIGVLSGGSRFFGGQSFSSYGTQSFYQPLYLYWDWIAANNPYRYVGANAGDGNWEDPTHWVSLTDPNYYIIDSNGEIVNGTPDNPGSGRDGTDGDWGAVCFLDDCLDFSTGEGFIATPAATVTDGRAEVELDSLLSTGDNSVDLTVSDASQPAEVALTESADSAGAVDPGYLTVTNLEDAPQTELSVDEVEDAPQAGPFSDDPLPAPTIENGLAGATDFVPDNQDPDVLVGVSSRYFDVTLSEDGITTLSSTVEVDNLAITGLGAGLNIASTGDLTSLIEINQLTGSVNVDGRLSTPGDYLLTSGVLTGTGTISTPFLTNVAGTIMPGTMGTVGTLAIEGSLITSSGSGLIVDITSTGNDLVTVTGDVSLGGTLIVNPVNTTLQAGDEYTFLTYAGNGSVDMTADLPGVLIGEIVNENGEVILVIDVGSYLDILPASATQEQIAMGAALDDARDKTLGGMDSLYASVDVLEGTDLTTAFNTMAPNDGLLGGHAMIAYSNAVRGQIGGRMSALRDGETGFVARNTGGIQVASLDPSAGLSSLAALQANADEAAATEIEGVELKEGWGLFVDLRAYQAEFDGNMTLDSGEFDGVMLTAGVDKTFESGVMLGAMISYNEAEGDLETVFGEIDQAGFSFGIYGSTPLWGGFADGYVTIGQQTLDTERTAVLGTEFQSVSGEADVAQFMAGASLGRDYELNSTLTLTPILGIHHAQFDFDDYTETGAGFALNVDSREVKSTQAYIGADATFSLNEGRIRPMVGFKLIHDLEGGRDVVTGRFAQSSSLAYVTATGSEMTKNWGEVELGLDIDISDTVTGALGVRQTFENDLEGTVFGGTLKVKF